MLFGRPFSGFVMTTVNPVMYRLVGWVLDCLFNCTKTTGDGRGVGWYGEPGVSTWERIRCTVQVSYIIKLVCIIVGAKHISTTFFHFLSHLVLDSEWNWNFEKRSEICNAIRHLVLKQVSLFWKCFWDDLEMHVSEYWFRSVQITMHVFAEVQLSDVPIGRWKHGLNNNAGRIWSRSSARCMSCRVS